MQGEHLINHNMKVINSNIVTAPLVPEATGVVCKAQVAPLDPSSPCKGERSGSPTLQSTPAKTANDTDNGLIPASNPT